MPQALESWAVRGAVVGRCWSSAVQDVACGGRGLVVADVVGVPVAELPGGVEAPAAQGRVGQEGADVVATGGDVDRRGAADVDGAEVQRGLTSSTVEPSRSVSGGRLTVGITAPASLRLRGRTPREGR